LPLAQGESRDYYYNESWQVVEERKDGAEISCVSPELLRE